MNKVVKILFVILCLLIVFSITFSLYRNAKLEISSKIGPKWTGGTLSTSDYRILQKQMEKYITYLQNKDYERAYHMLSIPYRQYQSLESFTKWAREISLDEVEVGGIQPLTKYLFEVKMMVGEETLPHLLFVSNSQSYIVPGTFLEAHTYQKTIQKSKAKYMLMEMVQYTDHVHVKLKITNQSARQSLSLTGFALMEDDRVIDKKNEEELLISPKESQIIELDFAARLQFPTSLRIYRLKADKEKEEVYEFSLL